MIQAMQSAIAGLKSHQTKMDVIGNNIANVNTWGYKAKSANFSDAMYQNYINGSAADATEGGRGGIDVSQVGYGSNVSSITANFETGGQSYTGNPYDCMITGSAFFIVGGFRQDPIATNTIKDSGMYLSRVGIFKTPNGYLTDDQGNYVYGYAVNDTTGEVTNPNELVPIKLPQYDPADADSYSAKSISIAQDGTISVTDENDKIHIIGKIALATVENTGGLEQSGGYLYNMGDNVGQVIVSEQNNSTGSVLSGYLEMPNVDLATEMANMITTQRGYQANTKMITVSDEMLDELVNMKR